MQPISAMALGDINNDGFSDIAIAQHITNPTSNQLLLILNEQGKRAQRESASISIGGTTMNTISSLAIGNLDDDQYGDILATVPAERAIYRLLQKYPRWPCPSIALRRAISTPARTFEQRFPVCLTVLCSARVTRTEKVRGVERHGTSEAMVWGFRRCCWADLRVRRMRGHYDGRGKAVGLYQSADGDCAGGANESRILEVRLYQLKQMVDPCQIDIDAFAAGRIWTS